MRNTHYIVAGLSDTDMIWLLSMGKLRTLRPGEALVAAGRAVDDLFFITRGDLVVVLQDQTRVTTLHEGDVVGEMSFVERHPPSASVHAEGPAEVLGVPRAAILQRFDSEPLFAARFYRALALLLSAKLRETTAAIRTAEEHDEVRAATAAAGARFGNLFSKFRG